MLDFLSSLTVEHKSTIFGGRRFSSGGREKNISLDDITKKFAKFVEKTPYVHQDTQKIVDKIRELDKQRKLDKAMNPITPIISIIGSLFYNRNKTLNKIEAKAKSFPHQARAEVTATQDISLSTDLEAFHDSEWLCSYITDHQKDFVLSNKWLVGTLFGLERVFLEEKSLELKFDWFARAQALLNQSRKLYDMVEGPCQYLAIQIAIDTIALCGHCNFQQLKPFISETLLDNLKNVSLPAEVDRKTQAYIKQQS
jgi:hypothetical protein